MVHDQSEMLTPTERAAAEAWQTKHSSTDKAARFVVTSAVSGFGYRMRVLCTACGAREDVTDKTGRDPIPQK